METSLVFFPSQNLFTCVEHAAEYVLKTSPETAMVQARGFLSTTPDVRCPGPCCCHLAELGVPLPEGNTGDSTNQGCFMISGMVVRLVGSSTKMRSSRSRASGDSAFTLSAMKGDSFHCLFTSCSLWGTPHTHSIRSQKTCLSVLRDLHLQAATFLACCLETATPVCHA